MQSLFYIGIIFVLGALVQWIAPKFGLPKVVGYLLLGLIIGPEILGIIPKHFVKDAGIITELALSLIAVLVGASLKHSRLQGMGKQIVTITSFEAFSAFLSVSIGLYLFSDLLSFPTDQSLTISILLGGLAAATAPAATIAVIHEYKMQGKFTSTLLAVVALDDAWALVIFTFSLTLGSMFLGNGSFSLTILYDIFFIITLSSLLGVVGAYISSKIDTLFAHSKSMETISTIGMVFIVFSLSSFWELEPLLSALVMGAVMTNICDDFDLIEDEIDNHLEEIIFMLFFIISAMHLKLNSLSSILYIVIAYSVFRIIGKSFGVWLGAKLTKADKNIQNYLGLALFPQAGVAIGLALSLQTKAGFETIAPLILNIIIATTLVHEFLGPIFAKYALKKSGELSDK